MKIADYDLEHEALRCLVKLPHGTYILEALNLDDFYFSDTQSFFRYLTERHQLNASINLRDLYDEEGMDLSFLSQLSNLPYGKNVSQIIRTLKAFSELRLLVERIDSFKISEVSRDNVLDKIEDFKSSVDGVLAGENISSRTSMDFDDSVLENDSYIDVIPYNDLSHIKYKPGMMMVIGARPGMGKTTFMLNLAIKSAAKSLIISYETTFNELIKKCLSIAKLNVSQKKEISHVRMIDSELELNRLITMIKSHNKEHGIQLFFIDYIHLIPTNVYKDNYRLQVAHISRKLKMLSMTLGICIVALAQSKRDTDERDPQLGDLKESGALEADCDVLLFLAADRYIPASRNLPAKKANEFKLDVFIRKNRYGKCSKESLFYYKPTGEINHGNFNDQ